MSNVNSDDPNTTGSDLAGLPENVNKPPRSRGSSRRRKRSSGGASAADTGVNQKPFQRHRFNSAPTNFVSDDELESIHLESLRVLDELGVRVLHSKARDIMRQHGARVDDDTEMVHFDPELVLSLVEHAPSSFRMHARNPAHDVVFGDGECVFAMMASAPNASCLDHGRRTGNREDYQNFLRLSQMHNVLQLNVGYPVEPVDLHASTRHLDCIHDILTLTDKSLGIYSLGAARNKDGIEMVRIARGISREELLEQPSVMTVINTNSPLQLDIPMMQGIIEMASTGQVLIMTPFTLAGAMAPVTIAGALVQQNAEALAVIAFSQMIRQGTPIIYGGFTSNVDMKSGSPAFGTPEYMKAQMVGGQLARRYNLPYRSSNVCAANTVDAQAAYESVFSLWGCINGQANLVMHGAGWMEGGLCCSFEKTILDIDLLQMVAEFLNPLDCSKDALAFDAMADVGPAGHFFATEHTQQRYRDAFYSPVISDWRNFETWQEAGSPDAMQKANSEWKKRLALYEKPAMDPAITEELAEFVERRKKAGGIETDF